MAEVANANSFMTYQPMSEEALRYALLHLPFEVQKRFLCDFIVKNPNLGVHLLQQVVTEWNQGPSGWQSPLRLLRPAVLKPEVVIDPS